MEENPQFYTTKTRIVRSNNYQHKTFSLPPLQGLNSPQPDKQKLPSHAKKSSIQLKSLNYINFQQEDYEKPQFLKSLHENQQQNQNQKKNRILKKSSSSCEDIIGSFLRYNRNQSQKEPDQFMNKTNEDESQIVMNSSKSQAVLPMFEQVRQEAQKKSQYQTTSGDYNLTSTEIQKKKKEFIIQKFSPAAQRKFKNEYHTLYEQIGGESILKNIIDRHYDYIESDPLFHQWFGAHRNLHYLKNSFVRFLSFATGHNSFYLCESLREKHKHLYFKTSHFDVFKFYLLRSFLEITHQEHNLLRFCTAVEQFRCVICNKDKSLSQFYNNLDNDPLNQEEDIFFKVSKQMYSKIISDKEPLGQFFDGININTQAEKFGIIFKELMNWNISSRGIDLDKLRLFHVKFNLKDIHYVAFRQYLINALRMEGFKDKEIYLISRRMDGFKPCILNRYSLQYLAQTHSAGKKFFLEKYSKLIFKDPRTKKILAELGRNFIQNHCEMIYLYFCNQQSLSLTLNDLRLLHNIDPAITCQKNTGNTQCPLKYIPNEDEVDAFIEHFQTTCQGLGMQQESLEDQLETWQPIKFNILNQLPIGKRIGKKVMKQLQQQVTERIEDRYKKYFQHSDFSMKDVMSRVIYFLLHDNKYYKKKDLQYIHANLKILESSYEHFYFLIEFEAKKLGIDDNYLAELRDLFDEYKPYIVQYSKEPQKEFEQDL